MLSRVSLRVGGLPRLVARVAIEDGVEEDDMRAAAATHTGGGGSEVLWGLGGDGGFRVLGGAGGSR
jgi:hypothetical protein